METDSNRQNPIRHVYELIRPIFTSSIFLTRLAHGYSCSKIRQKLQPRSFHCIFTSPDRFHGKIKTETDRLSDSLHKTGLPDRPPKTSTRQTLLTRSLLLPSKFANKQYAWKRWYGGCRLSCDTTRSRQGSRAKAFVRHAKGSRKRFRQTVVGPCSANGAVDQTHGSLMQPIYKEGETCRIFKI